MSEISNLKKLLEDLKKMKEGGIFKKYIDYIRFPFFKNLQKDTKIDFEFPITLFVGQNGGGKSSTLQALYGAPAGKSVGEFWFSTNMDPEEPSGERPAFIYAYTPARKQLEVLKTRIEKKINGGKRHIDYWEPSRPLVKYGMEKLPSGKRNEGINMDVIYIDFRSILSAFDKYFYYEEPKKLKSKTRQDYLREKSITLRKIIDEQIIIKRGRIPQDQNKLPEVISNEELNYMSQILGKDYKAGIFVEHKLFKNPGLSILFTTPNLTYSEAFAGSGEMAVATLVRQICKAPENSLVLLDEPEVSLHPKAQKQMRYFLLEQTKKKKLQVIICTHSPALIEDFPASAIKVFIQLPDGRFQVESDRQPEEAFHIIGQSYFNKTHIFVEDKLAKEILQAVINNMGEATASLFEIQYGPGGADVMYQDIANHVRRDLSIKEFFLFDGDKKPSTGHLDPSTFPEKDLTESFLKEKIKEQTGHGKINFYPDSNNHQQLIELMKNYLKFFITNVKYLPFDYPEKMLWSEKGAEKMLDFLELDSKEIKNKLAEIEKEPNFKKKFAILSDLVSSSDTSKDLSYLHNSFIRRWLQEKNDDYKSIEDQIKTMKQ